MKLIFGIIFLFAICQQNFSQETEIKTRLNKLNLKSIKNKKLVDYDLLSKTKNKIIMIEFWETWCGACIQSMSHLKILQNKYANDLQIICVASDEFEKTLDFIEKNTFPFDFIFDREKKLKELFPHSLKPFTVIIDKNGKIQAKTLPSYISETQIEQLISEQSIDVPIVKKYSEYRLEEERSQAPLVSFELQRHELGESSYHEISEHQNKARIITSYRANSFIDTVETNTELIASSKNILELYQLAYNNIPDTRFLYSDDLNYIKSHQPNHLYKLKFSVSNLFTKSNLILINYLNNSFGLNTQKIKMDTTVLILKKLELNGKSIKLADTKKGSSKRTRISNYQFFQIKGNNFDIQEIANCIGEKTQLPVEINIENDLKYELNIDIDKPGANIDEWIDFFEKEGLYLDKKKKTIDFITIKRQPITKL